MSLIYNQRCSRQATQVSSRRREEQDERSDECDERRERDEGRDERREREKMSDAIDERRESEKEKREKEKT